MQSTPDFSLYSKNAGSGLLHLAIAVEGINCVGCRAKIERNLSIIPDFTSAGGLVTPLSRPPQCPARPRLSIRCRAALSDGVSVMEVLAYLVPLALTLGAIGLIGFLWSLKSGQYEDLDGAAWRAIMDDE